MFRTVSMSSSTLVNLIFFLCGLTLVISKGFQILRIPFLNNNLLIMIVISIVYKQRMLITDFFMEIPFVKPAVIGLSNGEIVTQSN